MEQGWDVGAGGRGFAHRSPLWCHGGQGLCQWPTRQSWSANGTDFPALSPQVGAGRGLQEAGSLGTPRLPLLAVLGRPHL